MPKSSRQQQSSRKRRASQQIQQGDEPSSVGDVEPVARARRRSSSATVSSDKQTSISVSNSNQGNRRSSRLQRRQQEDNAALPIAAVGSNSIINENTSTTKRIASRTSGQSSQAGPSKKRKSSNLSVSIETSNMSDNATSGGPLTRSKRKAASQVITPSPAQTKPKVESTTFNFSTPPPKKRLDSFNSLPEGVIDIYPANDVKHGICACGQDDCTANALTSSFIHSYGKEYWQHLKDIEEPAIFPPSPTSSTGSRSRRLGFYSPDAGDDCDDAQSTATAETPEYNRDWVFLNPEAVDSPQLNESTTYLPYQPDLTPKMRSILVDWIIELSEHFNFGPTTLHLAVTLVDKVLACGPIRIDEDSDDDADSDEEEESKTNCFLISRERFQLLGAACTWVACKVEEMTPPNVDDFAYVSDNIYTTFQIKRMERRICKALNFACWHHTPLLFSYEFMRASHECPYTSCHNKSSALFNHMVMYMLELGRLPYSPVTRKPSLLAAAAVYLARANLGIRSNDTTLDPLGRWTRTLEYYSGYSKMDLKETVLAIHHYHLAAEESTLKSVFTKYKAKRYLKVALKTVPNVEDIGF